jgi:hypothetical protein
VFYSYVALVAASLSLQSANTCVSLATNCLLILVLLLQVHSIAAERGSELYMRLLVLKMTYSLCSAVMLCYLCKHLRRQ